MSLQLLATLSEFDGRSVEPFRRAAAELAADSRTLHRLARLAATEDGAVEIGATWILKDFLERQTPVSEALASKLILLSSTLEEPESKLHLLQLLPRLPLPENLAEPTWQAIRSELDGENRSDNKFVRAWAYNGLAWVASHHDRYRDRVVACFEKALESEAPAVKARIRNALKEL